MGHLVLEMGPYLEPRNVGCASDETQFDDAISVHRLAQIRLGEEELVSSVNP